MWNLLPRCSVLLFLLLGAGRYESDDLRDLKSKDPLVRLAAVERIADVGGPDAEKHLLRALGDDDWEVVERAATGLAANGGTKSVTPLTKLACDGPVRRVRLTAARSLAAIDPAAGLKGIGKKLSGERAPRAAEAYGLVALAHDEAASSKALETLVKGKETAARAAAARAWVLASGDERGPVVAKLLESEHAAVVAAALEGAALDPRVDQRAPLLAYLERPSLVDVLERRALVALARTAHAAGGTAANTSLFEAAKALGGAREAKVAARGPRLLELAANEAWFDAATLLDATASARGHAGVDARAAAAWSLRLGGADACLATAREIAESDADARVRRAALNACLALTDLEDVEARNWAVRRLATAKDDAVREDLVVALAIRNHPDAAAALARALEDSSWGVAACAAVSLGRTRDASAVSRLAPQLKSRDWRMRGAAVVGLSHCFDEKAIPLVIDALGDHEPAVRRTAHAWLTSINRGRPLPLDPELWQEWWAVNEKRIHLLDPQEEEERQKRFARSATLQNIYQGLDILVLQSRGDHLENVLQFLGIEFRTTGGGRVPESGCDATGVFVANCTGEMEPADVERLQWFVRVGGYLFGSCWAVHETIERVAPGAVRKLETLGEVMDRVTATPCSTTSPYLDGVFTGDVVPIYELEGAHLIEVLEPERVEILVDSAECAERWGGGNLACWFPFGHGKILDSVNHFDLQGFSRATSLKKPEDRMAYAVDHLGADYAKLRETRDEKFWTSNPRADAMIRDLSVFKLVTNFVRLRRLEGYSIRSQDNFDRLRPRRGGEGGQNCPDSVLGTKKPRSRGRERGCAGGEDDGS